MHVEIEHVVGAVGALGVLGGLWIRWRRRRRRALTQRAYLVALNNIAPEDHQALMKGEWPAFKGRGRRR